MSLILNLILVTSCQFANLDPETDTNGKQIDINVTMSNTTSECSVNCGNGTKTTTIVSCIGKKSSESGKFRIDDSLNCTTTLNHTDCPGNGSNCPGAYNLIREYKSYIN